MENLKLILEDTISDISSRNQLPIQGGDLNQFAHIVAGNENIREQFIEGLTEGMSEENAKSFTVYAKNSYQEAVTSRLTENAAANLSLFATLDNLLLREVFNRTGAREAMTYKVLNTPSLQIPYLRQYIMGNDGVKRSVPQALSADTFTSQAVDITIDLSVKNVDNVFEKLNVVSENKFSFVDPSKLTLKNFGQITEIECYTEDNYSGKKTIYKEPIIIGQEGNVCANITWIDEDGVTSTATLMGNINRKTGEVAFMANGTKVKSVKYSVVVSPETNQPSVFDLSQEMDKITITIGDGDSINSTLPISYLQDFKALFNVDALSEITRTMADTFGQIYDREVYNTFVNAIEIPEQKTHFNASMIIDGRHIGISQQMHNSGLLQTIYKAIAAIDTRNNFRSDTEFFVLCNPVQNADLAGSIAPEFAGGVVAGGQIKHYKGNQVLGGYNDGLVKTLTSKSYTEGKIYVVAKPKNDEHIAFGYYDYSQVLMPLGAYRNSANPLTPNIMMNKRKTIHTFRPEAAQEINVENGIDPYKV